MQQSIDNHKKAREIAEKGVSTQQVAADPSIGAISQSATSDDTENRIGNYVWVTDYLEIRTHYALYSYQIKIIYITHITYHYESNYYKEEEVVGVHNWLLYCSELSTFLLRQ